jgi:hypothetical protein
MGNKLILMSKEITRHDIKEIVKKNLGQVGPLVKRPSRSVFNLFVSKVAIIIKNTFQLYIIYTGCVHV